ncbi:MAG: hypothetical protein WEE89_00275 [Gemmatimonadota bacterium]
MVPVIGNEPAPTTTEPKKPAQVNERAGAVQPGVISRIIVFIGLAAVADLWANHNFGFGVRNLAVPAGLAAAVGAVIKLAGTVFGESSVQTAISPFRNLAMRFVGPLITVPALAWFAVLLTAAAATISSVTVFAEGESDRTTIRIAALDRPDATDSATVGDDRQMKHFLVTTTPFGRLFRVAATGYVTESFTVYPPMGRRIRLGSDLAVLPPVLFRPSTQGLSFLHDGAVLLILRARAGGQDTLVTDSGHAGSFWFGRPGPITAAMESDWTNELKAMSAPEALIADHILKWKKARPLSSRLGLRPGDQLRAELLVNGTLVCEGEAILSGSSPIDVRMTDVAVR